MVLRQLRKKLYFKYPAIHRDLALHVPEWGDLNYLFVSWEGIQWPVKCTCKMEGGEERCLLILKQNRDSSKKKNKTKGVVWDCG